MKQFMEDYRRLAALTEFASKDKVTQRSLAACLGISLGWVNALLHRLEDERLITVSRSGHVRSPRYALTNRGRGELRRVAAAMAVEAGAMLEGPRRELEEQARSLRADGRRRALLCGCGPLADVAASALRNGGLKLVGVVSPVAGPGRVAGKRVRPLADAAAIQCDVAVCVAAQDAAALRRGLGKGVPMIQFLPSSTRRGKRRG